MFEVGFFGGLLLGFIVGAIISVLIWYFKIKKKMLNMASTGQKVAIDLTKKVVLDQAKKTLDYHHRVK